jgi:hypothetical protein
MRFWLAWLDFVIGLQTQDTRCKSARGTNTSSPTAPSVETPEQVAEPERAVEKEAEMFDCAIEGEGQDSWMDLVVAAP